MPSRAGCRKPVASCRLARVSCCELLEKHRSPAQKPEEGCIRRLFHAIVCFMSGRQMSHSDSFDVSCSAGMRSTLMPVARKDGNLGGWQAQRRIITTIPSQHSHRLGAPSLVLSSRSFKVNLAVMEYINAAPNSSALATQAQSFSLLNIYIPVTFLRHNGRRPLATPKGRKKGIIHSGGTSEKPSLEACVSQTQPS